MSARPSSDADRLALKAAFRAQMRACGGQEAAADVTRVGQPALSRYGAASHPNEHAPLDILLDLVRDTGNPVVLQRLCRLAGGAYVPLSGFGADAGPRGGSNATPGFWTKALLEAVGRGGRAADALSTALADDGDISAREITDLEIRESLAAAIEALLVLDRFAASVEGETT